MKKIIYLAGTIEGKDCDEVIEKFTSKQKLLEKIGYKVLSPIRGKDVRELAASLDGTATYSPNEIMHRDLNDIDNCDIVIAFMDYPSIGTSMEIIYARYVRHVPVILVSRSPRVYYHPWITSLVSKKVRTTKQAIEHLKKWWS